MEKSMDKVTRVMMNYIKMFAISKIHNVQIFKKLI